MSILAWPRYDSILAQTVWRWPNFSPKELSCKGSKQLMINIQAVDALQAVRSELGQVMQITSAYRTPLHNFNVGGSPRSRHMLGEAFDVKHGDFEVDDFVTLARKYGFKGIGYYSTFTHIDLGPERIWTQE